MSTDYYFRNTIRREELESVGVKFQDGMLNEKPHTWIIEKENTNYLHPHHDTDNIIYGFTRFGGNDPSYLIDILDSNGIEWCDEYDLEDSFPVDSIVEELGINLDNYTITDDDLVNILYEEKYDDWYTLDYYWAEIDGKGNEYIKEWCNENKVDIISFIEKEGE